MNASGMLHASTPQQCKHDSGFISYPKDIELSQELSPVRKRPSANSLKQISNLPDWNARFDAAVSKILSNSSDINDNIHNDSGIDVSVSNIQKSFDKKTQFFTDEMFSLKNATHCTKSKLHQPFKYICTDFKSCKLNLSVGVFTKTCLIISDLIRPREERRAKLDILNELNIRNCTSTISEILSYLSDEDLVRACSVNAMWKHIVLSDPNAQKRKTSYLNMKILQRTDSTYISNKENKSEIVSLAKRNHEAAFTFVNTKKETANPPVVDTSSRVFDSFLHERKTIGQKQALMKCPKCCYAAKATDEYKYCCTRNLCKYEFCKTCSGPYLHNHVCSVPKFDKSLSNIIICSKKSQKNLRRLSRLRA